MAEKKIDVTSSAVEKGLNIAKDFLDKLIVPTVEETGLLFKDKVTMWRFNNQIKMLTKAKEYCEKNKIDPKKISLKVVCPLLDYAALEEDEILQDKWSILLTNLVDSDQNIQNHVFPYILSQISRNEFNFLDGINKKRLARIKHLKKELELLLLNRPILIKSLEEQIRPIEARLIELKKINDRSQIYEEYTRLDSEVAKLKGKINSLNWKDGSIERKLKEPEIVPIEIENFEVANLSRLGLIKEVHETSTNSDTAQIPQQGSVFGFANSIEFLTDMEMTSKYILTQLGELFLDACTLKSEVQKR